MPFVSGCPHCRQPLTLHESQAGTVVACPTCRGPLTVPGPSVPEQHFTVHPDSTGTRRWRYERASPVRPMAVFLVLVGLLVAATAGVYWWNQTRDADRRTNATADRPAPTPAQPPAPKPTPRPDRKKVEPPKPPEPPKPLTFEEAYDAAEKEGIRRDAEEPTLTGKAVKLLTAPELLGVRYMLDNPGSAAVYPNEGWGMLAAAGLVEFRARASRLVAREDPKFKPVARKLWDPTTGAAGILRMMEEWGPVGGWRRWVSQAIEADTPTQLLSLEARDAILLLGGRRWLENH